MIKSLTSLTDIIIGPSSQAGADSCEEMGRVGSRALIVNRHVPLLRVVGDLPLLNNQLCKPVQLALQVYHMAHVRPGAPCAVERINRFSDDDFRCITSEIKRIYARRKRGLFLSFARLGFVAALLSSGA